MNTGLHLASDLQLRDVALDLIRFGLCVFDARQHLLLFNRKYAEMYDLNPDQLWIGMTLRDVVDLRYAAGTGPTMSPSEYAAWRDRIGTSDQTVNSEVTLGDGRIHAIHHVPTPCGGWVATFEDITERREAEAMVRHMAHHDALTGLPNRSLFIERTGSSLSRLWGRCSLDDHRGNTSAEASMIAVLFLDLDHFKRVNDTLGHAAGDMLLEIVGARIRGCLRIDDTLARMGGDEFAILLSEDIVCEEQAVQIADRIVHAVSAPYKLEGHDIAISVSVGIATCSRQNESALDPHRLLRSADIALYNAKASGRGRCCLFGQSVNQSVSQSVRQSGV